MTYRTRTLKALAASTGIAAVWLLGVSPSSAQTAQNPAGASAPARPAGLEEIVVTAEKRISDTQRTPAAVTAVAGDELTDLGIHDSRGFEQIIPSAVFKQSGSVTQTFIRGVGSNLSLPAVDPGVSFNINGVYIPREVGSNPVFDTDRIEVLPGPQGTLWGRGAAGGAVNVITNKPTKEYEGSALFEIGNFNRLHTTLVANIPISDTLQIRGALDANRRDGYLSNGGNDDEGIGGRVTIAYQPTENLSILLRGSHFQNGGIGPVTVPTNPFLKADDRWYAPTSTNGLFQKLSNYVVDAEVNYDVGGVRITYIPAYVKAHVNLSIGSGALPFGIPGLNSNPLHQQIDEKQQSHELRFSNKTSGRFNWVTGLYYYHFTERFLQATPSATPPFIFTNTTYIPNQVNTSYAAFGQGTYSVTDRFRVTAGGRYSSDTKDLDIGFINIGGVQTPISAHHTWAKFDWKLGVEADVGERSMLYATIQTGGIPGGYAQAPATATFDNIVKKAELMSYTVGMKNRFFDNRLEINGEAFYYDYKNYQITALLAVAHTNVLLNAEKTTIYGAQMDARFLLTPDDQFDLSIGLLHAKYIDFIIAGTTIQDYGGYDIVNAPKTTVHFSYSHDWHFSNDQSMTAMLQTSYNGGEWTNFNHTPGNYQPAFSKTNVSLTYYGPDKRWNVAAYVNNIENAWVLGAVGPGFAYLEEPRTYGLRVGANF